MKLNVTSRGLSAKFWPREGDLMCKLHQICTFFVVFSNHHIKLSQSAEEERCSYCHYLKNIATWYNLTTLGCVLAPRRSNTNKSELCKCQQSAVRYKQESSVSRATLVTLRAKSQVYKFFCGVTLTG